MSESETRILKVALFGTVYYTVLAFVYVSLIRGLPESFFLTFDTTTPVTAPEIAVPALVLFGASVLVAHGVHGKGASPQ